MNECWYFDSDALQGETSVTQCAAGDDGLYQVVLSRTLFHPQGGGQLCDTGSIGDARVERVIHGAHGIVHLTDRAVPLGDCVIAVDGARRLLNSRLHSAGHLINHVGEEFGWHAVKGHHWPGESRVVFEAHGRAPAPDLAALQARCNQCIAEDLPRQTSSENGIRMVRFGDLPATPCGGTHVTSLAVIGQLHIEKIKEKKGQLTVSYAVAD
jgi:Ser-tRNA(Ala) deacylase AlaX